MHSYGVYSSGFGVIVFVNPTPKPLTTPSDFAQTVRAT